MIHPKAGLAASDRSRRGHGVGLAAGIAFMATITGCQENPEPLSSGEERGATTFVVSSPGTNPTAARPTAHPKRAVIEVRSNAIVEGVGPTRQSDLPGVRIELSFEETAGHGAIGFFIREVTLIGGEASGPREEALMNDLATQDVRVLRGAFRPESVEASASVELPTPSAASRPVVELLRQVEQALAAVAVPIPRQPIGDGADWTSTRDIAMAGVEWDQRFRCAATRDDSGGPLVVHVESDLRAAPQTYLMPGLPAGDRAEIIDARATLRGTWEGAAAAPLPTRADLILES